MKRTVFLFWFIFALSACESSPSKNTQPSEPTTTTEEENQQENYDADSEQTAAVKIRKPSSKTQKALSKIYNLEYSFDKLVKLFVNATNAVPNEYSIYKYDLNFNFFPAGSGKPAGQVDVLSKAGNKYFSIDTAKKSRIKKHFLVGTRTKNGFCGACFFETDQISYALGVAYYAQPGPSSAFFAGSIKFLRGQGNKTHILVGAGQGFKTPFTVTGFAVKKNKVELLYQDGKKNLYKTEISLNPTLDVESFFKKESDKEFRLMARLSGGVVDKYAVK